MNHSTSARHGLCRLSLLGAALVILTTPAHAQDASGPPLLPGMETSAPADDGLSEAPGLPEAPALPGAPALPAGPEAAFGLEGAVGDDFNFEESAQSLEEETRSRAFDAALQGLLPLRPEEIRRLLEHFDRTQESVELPVYPAPKPEVVVESLAMDPGTAPTVIKTAYGFVTTLNFLDSTGAPWPVQSITWAGNFDVVEATVPDDKYTNRILITPQSEFAYGNMSVHMLHLGAPIIISLETSRDVVHYRFDAVVPETGPLASTPLIEGGASMAAGDTDMSALLEGVPPKRAVRMAVSGVDSRTSAYRLNGMTYLRTPMTLLSPTWVASASSADGMRIYSMGHAPVVLLSDNGKLTRARLSDREENTNE